MYLNNKNALLILDTVTVNHPFLFSGTWQADNFVFLFLCLSNSLNTSFKVFVYCPTDFLFDETCQKLFWTLFWLLLWTLFWTSVAKSKYNFWIPSQLPFSVTWNVLFVIFCLFLLSSMVKLILNNSFLKKLFGKNATRILELSAKKSIFFPFFSLKISEI
jgi:hypothetical protein